AALARGHPGSAGHAGAHASLGQRAILAREAAASLRHLGGLEPAPGPAEAGARPGWRRTRVRGGRGRGPAAADLLGRVYPPPSNARLCAGTILEPSGMFCSTIIPTIGRASLNRAVE